MKRILGWMVALLFAGVLSACATADVSGQRMSNGAPSVAFKSVDVIFVDQATMKKSGLSALRMDTSADATLMSRAGGDLRRAMSEVREGVVDALAANGIPGRAYLVSRRDEQGPASPTHAVVVSMRSAVTSPSSPTKLTLNVDVIEVATNQIMWKGASELYPGGAGFSKEASAKSALEKRQRFGEGIVRALRDSGLQLPTSNPSASASK